MDTYGQRFLRWISECNSRKDYIRRATEEWRKRVQQREIARRQWDEYVAEARLAVVEAKTYPLPQRPDKTVP